MAQKHRSRPARNGTARDCDCFGEQNSPEFSPSLLDLQARHIVRRTPISMTAARIVAELCFSTGRAA
jgi:hypothetical protein